MEALKYATNAGRHASSLGAHREAAAQFERAVKWSSRTEPRALAVLYDDLSQELGLLDRWQDSADAHAQAMGLWRHLGDPLREGDALRRLSRIMWHMCRGEEAERAALDSVCILERGGPSPELAWACANLAHQRAINGDNQEAFELARRARAMAERFDLSHVVCETLNTEGWVAPSLGRDWVAPLHQALEVAIDAGLAIEEATAFCSLYDLNQSSLRFPEADQVFNDAIAYCESRDLTTFAIHLLGERTIHLEKVGRWDESVRLASSLLDRRGPTPLLRVNPLISLGLVQARRREPDAWQSLNEALILAQGVRDLYGVVEARIGLAEAHWLEQSTEAATLEIDEAYKALRDDPMCRSWLAVWRHRITGCNVMADLPEPFASEVAGNHLHAAELWAELGVGYHAAVALMGTDDEGPLRDAVRRFDMLGAKATAWLTRVKMRRLGFAAVPTGARSSTREHPAGLTTREREVLELVSAGLTNDEMLSEAAGRLGEDSGPPRLGNLGQTRSQQPQGGCQGGVPPGLRRRPRWGTQHPIWVVATDSSGSCIVVPSQRTPTPEGAPDVPLSLDVRTPNRRVSMAGVATGHSAGPQIQGNHDFCFFGIGLTSSREGSSAFRRPHQPMRRGTRMTRRTARHWSPPGARSQHFTGIRKPFL